MNVKKNQEEVQEMDISIRNKNAQVIDLNSRLDTLLKRKKLNKLWGNRRNLPEHKMDKMIERREKLRDKAKTKGKRQYISRMNVRRKK